MKVERKKAREETDVVNVVEWLSSDDERFFILVRRPETGTVLVDYVSKTYADAKCRAARWTARISFPSRRQGFRRFA